MADALLCLVLILIAEFECFYWGIKQSTRSLCSSSIILMYQQCLMFFWSWAQPYRWQLTAYNRRWALLCAIKGPLPSCTISRLFMWHIGLQFVTVHGHVFNHDNKPPFVVVAAFSTRLLYCRPLCLHSAESSTLSFSFCPLTVPCYQGCTSNTIIQWMPWLKWV